MTDSSIVYVGCKSSPRKLKDTKEMIQYCFNGVPYFILGDQNLGILFTDFRDMCRVENSWGCIENGVVWREGELVKNELENMEPKGTWNGSIHKCCGSRSRGWHLGSCENAKTNKKHDPLEQRFFLLMGKYPVNEAELTQFKESELEKKAANGWAIRTVDK